MARLFWLSDGAWAVIEPHLPRGLPGKPRVDDRRVISLRGPSVRASCTCSKWGAAGATCRPSRGLPPRSTIATAGGRGGACGNACSRKVAATGKVPAELSLDSTHVKAHRSASGGKGGNGPKRSGARGVGAQARSTAWPMIAADRSRSR